MIEKQFVLFQKLKLPHFSIGILLKGYQDTKRIIQLESQLAYVEQEKKKLDSHQSQRKPFHHTRYNLPPVLNHPFFCHRRAVSIVC